MLGFYHPIREPSQSGHAAFIQIRGKYGVSDQLLGFHGRFVLEPFAEICGMFVLTDIYSTNFDCSQRYKHYNCESIRLGKTGLYAHSDAKNDAKMGKSGLFAQLRHGFRAQVQAGATSGQPLSA